MNLLIYAVVAMVVSLIVSFAMMRSQQNKMSAQDVEVTTAEEGVTNKVVLGTRDVKGSVVWFGDQKSQAIKK
ncbi:hypothetical protein [Acinetobacter sp. YH12251]|uniref:hypothetical protein n=1 Tax=Acinetobacter sp. YH12251 TaxID=2601176 RepID=UPI001C550040|nr:hypothetical protein [Acinetobacter sp. YH12251]